MGNNVKKESIPSTIPADLYKSLQEAFDDFQKRADKLSLAYQAMQEEFRKLNLELDKKNHELAESLKQQEEMRTYINSILESMNSGVIGVDLIGNITLFNNAACEITGYDQSEMVGNRYSDVFQNSKDRVPDPVSVLKEGRDHKWDEKVIWHKEGTPVPVSFQTALLKDNSARTIGAVEIFSDMSKIKALEKEMQHTKTLAALGEMSATVAHELRNPLGAMGVWAGLLERDFNGDDPRRKTLKKIIDSLSRLNKIVSNLLVYSRPFNAQFREVQLGDLIEETLNFVEIEIERLDKPIQIDRMLKSDEDIVVRGDPEKLQQVIMNLCINAIQAISNRGKITVLLKETLKKKKNYACFVIEDTGVGIEPARIERIFDPFHTSKEKGTGLGLAIVKKYIEHHNGYIDISSEKGRGTKFNVFLPVV